MPEDLSFVETDELIEELKARSRSFVIGIEPKADTKLYKICRHGDKLGIAGLLRSLTLESDHHLMNDERDQPKEE